MAEQPEDEVVGVLQGGADLEEVLPRHPAGAHRAALEDLRDAEGGRALEGGEEVGRALGGAVVGEGGSPEGSAPGVLDQVAGREPTPEFAAEVAEESRLLLGRLDNAELQAIAVWKMEGLTNDEIAARLRCATSTVERRLRLIRKLWSAEGEEAA